MNAELQQWLGDHGYGDVAAAVDALNEDFAALNADVESQARADWINDARDELAAFLVSNGYEYVDSPSIDSDSPDLDAINAVILAAVDAQWIIDANAALQQWIVVRGTARWGRRASPTFVPTSTRLMPSSKPPRRRITWTT